MNKTLQALMKKLHWQLSELRLQLQAVDQQLAQINQQRDDNQQKIVKACAIPAFIMPEREISRLHFMIRQQQQQVELNTNKTALLSQQLTLNSRQLRINTELKMLEKHQENQLKNTQQQRIVKQQNDSDEWVLQRREPT